MCEVPAEVRFRDLVQHEFGDEFKTGFFLSYFRNFAVPEIASVLGRSGLIGREPAKRSYDTAIVIYELISDGVDGPRGKEMIRLLCNAHRGVPGSPDDFLYVLLTLLVVPFDFIRVFGRRPLTDEEKDSGLKFFREVGARMGVDLPFDRYSAAELFFRRYEEERQGKTAAGLRLFEVTVGLYEERIPAILRPWARKTLAVIFDSHRLTDALGLPVPSAWYRGAVRWALKARSILTGRKREPAFSPGRPLSSVYPNGYVITDLGPRRVRPAE